MSGRQMSDHRRTVSARPIGLALLASSAPGPMASVLGSIIRAGRRRAAPDS